MTYSCLHFLLVETTAPHQNAVALYTFAGVEEDDLPFKEGEKLVIYSECEGWCWGACVGGCMYCM